MRLKWKSLVFTVSLLSSIGGIIAVDWVMAEITSIESIKSSNTIDKIYITTIEHRLNRVRDALSALDTGRAESCDAGATEARGAIILAVPELKGIAVVGTGDTIICSTPSLQLTAAAAFKDNTIELSPTERFDIVTLGPDGALAVRLQHKILNAEANLAAIVPIADLVVGLGPSLSQIADQSANRNHVRLAIGGHAIVDISGNPINGETAIPAPTSNITDDAAVRETASTQGGITRASDIYPLSVTLTGPRPAFATRIDRIVTDIALSAAFGGLLLTVFLRRSEPAFGPRRFERSIRRNEFSVAYRPVVDLHSGKLAGAVAEIHWHRTGGIVLSQSDFMAAVIRAGSDQQMLRFVLRKCQADLSVAYRLRPSLQLKVEIDHATLSRPGFVDYVRRSLSGPSLRPSQLTLMVNPIEGAVNPNRLRDVLRDLQKMGVMLEVRQSTGEIIFGTGNDEVPAAAIGVDSRLVQALDQRSDAGVEQANLWIGRIVAACAGTGIRVCAYGVHGFDTLKHLKALGIDEVEGGVFAPPLTPGSFMALVARAGLDRGDAATKPDAEPSRRSAGA